MNSETHEQWYYKIIYFFIANQIFIKRLMVMILILFNIALWWIGGVKIINYLADSKNYEQTILVLSAPVVDWQKIHEATKPQDIQILSVEKISLGNNKYNLVAKIFNPNARYSVAYLNYAFMVDGFVLDWQDSFINPESEKYLFSFSYVSENYPSEISLKLGGISWSPINNFKKETAVPMDQIEVLNTNFVQDNNQNIIDFEVINKTHFNFWQIGWQVLLFQGERLVGVNYLTSSGFLSGETRKLSVASLEKIPTPSRIEILPDIDIFDKNNYFFNNQPAVNLIKGVRIKK